MMKILALVVLVAVLSGCVVLRITTNVPGGYYVTTLEIAEPW